MTTAPNPTVSLSTIDGTTRTLNDWTTITTQCWVVLPSKLESIDFLEVGEQIFKTFGDSSARCAYLIPGDIDQAKEIMSHSNIETTCFVDPEMEVIKSLEISSGPTLVYIRQDTSVAHIAQGFSYESWNNTCQDIAKSLRWTAPSLNKYKNFKDTSFLLV